MSITITTGTGTAKGATVPLLRAAVLALLCTPSLSACLEAPSSVRHPAPVPALHRVAQSLHCRCCRRCPLLQRLSAVQLLLALMRVAVVPRPQLAPALVPGAVLQVRAVPLLLWNCSMLPCACHRTPNYSQAPKQRQLQMRLPVQLLQRASCAHWCPTRRCPPVGLPAPTTRLRRWRPR